MSDNNNQYQKELGYKLSFLPKMKQAVKIVLLSKKCKGGLSRNAMILIKRVLTLINSGLQITGNQNVKVANIVTKITKNIYVKYAKNYIFVLTLLSNRCYL